MDIGQVHQHSPTNGCAGGAGLPNISANGFPNCNKSSDAFAFGGWLEAAVGPNKSTIFPEVVGDDKNGLFTAAFAPPVGEANFDLYWFKMASSSARACCLRFSSIPFE